MRAIKALATIVLAAIMSCMATGCEGPQGPVGPAGPLGQTGAEGPQGEPGADGKDGRSTSAASHVLAFTCSHCHKERYAQWSGTGHAHAMVWVNGAAPGSPPCSDYPSQPPGGHTWQNISYIVGGFSTAAVFADAAGYLITGPESRYLTQQEQWTEFEKDTPEGTKTMGCPDCHATHFKRLDGHEIWDKQLDLEGVEGSWVEEGVTCEHCHGPGSRHAAAQGYEWIRIDRDSARCGGCHGRQPLDEITADGGLIAQAQQHNEIAATRMKIVQCVDCHDPHRSILCLDGETNPEAGIVSSCESCHYKMSGKHQVASHATQTGGPGCVACHMPFAVRSTAHGAGTAGGELRSHIFRINPDISAPQLATDGKTVSPFLTISVACRPCHPDPLDKTDAQLQAAAAGYHD